MPGNPMGVAKAANEALPYYISDLIQVNIEAVETRYCDDLDAYWTYMRQNIVKEAGDIHPAELADKSPASQKEKKEAGWVVEVRGFTFHNAGRRFLNELVAENIARHGMPDFNPAEKDKPLPDKGPVLNRISHVVLLPDPAYGVTKRADDKAAFDRIDKSYVEAFIKESQLAAAPVGAAGPGGAPPPAMAVGGAAAGNTRDGWVAANGVNAGAAAPGGIRPGRRGGPGGIAPGVAPGVGAVGAEDATAPPRTEFVILFIWKEPTPSDKLRGLDDPAAGQPVQPGQPVRPGG
jgi:hypothetical protein